MTIYNKSWLLLILLLILIVCGHCKVSYNNKQFEFKVDKSQERCNNVINIIKKAQGIDLSHSNLSPSQRKHKEYKVYVEKFHKMKSRLSRFYRGINGLFIYDMLESSKNYIGNVWPFSGEDTISVIGGDSHLQNFGTYHTAHYENVIYDLNDFDDSHISDYTYDLWRLAVGIVINAYEGDFNTKKKKKLVKIMAKSYLHALSLARKSEVEKDVEFDRQTTGGVLGKFVRKVSKWYASGEAAQKQVLYRYCQYPRYGTRQHAIRREWKLQPATADERKSIKRSIPKYEKTLVGLEKGEMDDEYFYVKDVSHRLHQGLSSLGGDRLWVIIEGKTKSPWDDVILDVKASSDPTWMMYKDKFPQYIVDINEKAFGKKTAGERATICQRAMIANVNEHNGWLNIGPQSYVVKTRSPYKNRIGHKRIRKHNNLNNLAMWWGRIIAKAHARGDNSTMKEFIPYSFEDNLISKLESMRVDGVDYSGDTADPFTSNTNIFADMVANLAVNYQQQLVSDFRCFKKWYKSGALDKEYEVAEEDDDDDDEEEEDDDDE